MLKTIYLIVVVLLGSTTAAINWDPSLSVNSGQLDLVDSYEKPALVKLRSRLFRREDSCETAGHSLCPLKAGCCKEGLICVGRGAGVASCSGGTLNCTDPGYEVSCDGGRTSLIGCCKNSSKCDFSGQVLSCTSDTQGQSSDVPPIIAPTVATGSVSEPTATSVSSTAESPAVDYKPSAVTHKDAKSTPIGTIVGVSIGGAVLLYLLFEGWWYAIARRKGPVMMLLFAIASCCRGRERNDETIPANGQNRMTTIGGIHRKGTSSKSGAQEVERRAKSPEIPPPDFGPPVYSGLDLGPVGPHKGKVRVV